jgi:hypothetical protein
VTEIRWQKEGKQTLEGPMHMAIQTQQQRAKLGASWRMRESSELAVDLMKAAIRVDEPQLNALAFELLGRLMQGHVRQFSHQATNPRNAIQDRVASLKAIEEIGVVRDTSIWLDLFRLTTEKNDLVSAAAAELIEALREIRARAEEARDP